MGDREHRAFQEIRTEGVFDSDLEFDRYGLSEPLQADRQDNKEPEVYSPQGFLTDHKKEEASVHAPHRASLLRWLNKEDLWGQA